MQQFSQICTEDGENKVVKTQVYFVQVGIQLKSHHQPKQEQGTELVASC